MNKLLVFLISVLLVPAFAEPALAQTADFGARAGVTPDNFLWSIDVFFDNIWINLGSDTERGIRALNVAEERLYETAVMAEQGRLEDADRSATEYSESLNQISIERSTGEDARAIVEISQKAESQAILVDALAITTKAELTASGSEASIPAVDGLWVNLKENSSRMVDRIFPYLSELDTTMYDDLSEEINEPWKSEANRTLTTAHGRLLEAKVKVSTTRQEYVSLVEESERILNLADQAYSERKYRKAFELADLSLGISGVAIYSGPASAVSGGLQGEGGSSIYLCEQDSDCAKVKADYCGCNNGGTATSVNTKYATEYEDKLTSSDTVCTTVISNDPSCTAEPVCENSKCVLR